MRNTIGLLTTLWLGATVSGGAEPTATASIDQLRWLAGCWSYIGGEPGSGEQWTAPAGGTMLASGRTVRQGQTVAHEFLIIRQTATGGLEYVANPSGQEPAAFQLEAVEPRGFVFANPEHDFPQRIIYSLQPDGVLAARIEGVVSGEQRSVDFPMEPADCMKR